MRVHTIAYDDSSSIVLCPDTLRFFVASKDAAALVDEIAEGVTFEHAQSTRPGLSREVYSSFVKRIADGELAASCEVPERALPRLVINISNDCNMRCRYCYADCGVYGGERSLITKETLSQTLDYFFNAYETIGLVQLFGGEPTMNPEAISFVCNYLRQNEITSKVGFVTNATLIDDDLIKTVAEYDLNVTVSVDVETMHDLLRPLRGGEPSWEVVKNNIHKLQATTCQPTTIELTYTQAHVDKGISIVDVLTDLNYEYGSIPIHITPVCSDDPAFHLVNRDAFADSVHDVFESRRSGMQLNFALIDSYIASLKGKHANAHICNAGAGTLAVSTDGDIFPCFFFIGNQKFKIANVADDVQILDKAIRSKKQEYLARTKDSLETCKSCWANTLCHGCLGANEDSTGDQFITPVEQCDMTRSLIENLIRELTTFTRTKKN